MDDAYCKLFIKSEMDQADLTKLIDQIIFGEAGWEARQNNRELDLDLVINKDAKWNTDNSLKDDYLYYPFFADIDIASQGVKKADYKNAIFNLIAGLSETGIHAVAACDFEDFLKDKLSCLGITTW